MEKRPALSRPAPHAAPRAVLFDAYGTSFDVYSVALVAEQLFAGQGERLAQLWRDKQIEYTRLVSMSGPKHYQPFWTLTRSALQWTAARLNLAWSTDAEERLMNQYRHLSAFPENREVLEALKRQGVPAGILSNGDPDMLAIALRSAGLSDLIAPVLSVHTTRRFKTDPAAYQVGVDALGLPPKEILFVSSNGWDALGATWFGYTTLWVNRQHLPFETIGPKPTYTGHDLTRVLDVFNH